MAQPPTDTFKAMRDTWSTVAPYVAPSAAAAVAINPPFYGFVAKSHQQLGEPIPRLYFTKKMLEAAKAKGSKHLPRMTVLNLMKAGFRASPSVGLTVGTQMVAQELFEKEIVKRLYPGIKPGEPAPFPMMVASSAVVGAVSSPLLAIFNAQTMGYSVRQAIRMFEMRQLAAITVREVSFLFSLRASDPVCAFMREQFGDNNAVDTGAAFTTGFVGCLAGHPADTALTLWQKGMKMGWRASMRGGPAKAVAVGVFTVLYRNVKAFLMPEEETQE